jgi:hypothetical protein
LLIIKSLQKKRRRLPSPATEAKISKTAISRPTLLVPRASLVYRRLESSVPCHFTKILFARGRVDLFPPSGGAVIHRFVKLNPSKRAIQRRSAEDETRSEQAEDKLLRTQQARLEKTEANSASFDRQPAIDHERLLT